MDLFLKKTRRMDRWMGNQCNSSILEFGSTHLAIV